MTNILTFPVPRFGVQLYIFLIIFFLIVGDDGIDDYGKDLFQKEKEEMKDVDGYQLIDQIKQSVEMLMNMKMDDNINSSME